MELTEHVMEFRRLQKTQRKIRVADYCRANTLDYYEMVEALKKEKQKSEMGEEEDVQVGELELTDMPLSSPSSMAVNFIQDVHIKTPSELSVHIHGITAQDLIVVVQHLMQLKPC